MKLIKIDHSINTSARTLRTAIRNDTIPVRMQDERGKGEVIDPIDLSRNLIRVAQLSLPKTTGEQSRKTSENTRRHTKEGRDSFFSLVHRVVVPEDEEDVRIVHT